MPRFSVYAFDPFTSERAVELTEFTEFSCTHGLAGYGSGSLTCPWWSDATASVAAMASGIALDDGGVIRWSGLVTSMELNPDSGTVRYGMGSWFDYLQSRWVNDRTGMSFAGGDGDLDVTFTDIDQFNIVQDLCDHAEAIGSGASLPLTVRMFGPGTAGVSEVTRTRQFWGYERKRIAAIIAELAAQQDGFDFTIASEWDTATEPASAARYLDLFYPRRGAAESSVALEHGTNVTMLNVVYEGRDMGNPLTAVGAGIGDAALVVAIEDSSYRYPSGSYPYIERDVQFRDEGAEFAGNLTRHALAQLVIGREPLATARCALTEQPGPGGLQLGDVGIGDSPQVIAAFGAHSIQERMRVVTESITVTPVGLQQWTLSLASNDATLGV